MFQGYGKMISDVEEVSCLPDAIKNSLNAEDLL